MPSTNDYLILKWGTLKGWCFQSSPEAFEALKEYNAIGSSLSAMAQSNTIRQKELICLMIEKVNGPVKNDWSGDTYDSKEDAKKYIMEYNQ